MGTKTAILEISFNTREFTFVRLPTQGIMHPKKCSRQSIPSILGGCLLHLQLKYTVSSYKVCLSDCILAFQEVFPSEYLSTSEIRAKIQ
jgi:hypothetical protein